MSLIQKISLTILVIGAMLVAAFFFVWIFVFLAIAAPIVYLWWRWKLKKFKNAMRKRSATVIIEHKRLE